VSKLLFALLIVMPLASACGSLPATSAPAPTRVVQVAPTSEPTSSPAPMAPSALPPSTEPPAPPAVADAGASLPATAALRPGSGQVLGDAWTRPTDGMVMVYVPGGSFEMGSTQAQIEAAIALCRQHYSPCNDWYYEREAPVHTVSLAGFWIDQFEVTNAQYRRCVEDGVCSEPLTCKKGEPTYADPEKTDHPVVCVSWDDAQAYCEWAGARLPTEAEWEYAFRGEQGRIYPWGDSFDGSRLNYCDANCTQSHADDEYDDGYSNTAPVGDFPQDVSWSGAVGMSGNVSEWVADWFGAYSPEAVSNPIGPESGNEKMLKGCGWFSPPAYCRGAARPSVDPDARYDYLGFRCACRQGNPTPVLDPSAVPASEESVGSCPPSATQIAVAVPQGLPPVIDGTIAPEEWESARRELFADGSELFLMHAGGYLYLSIRASTPGMIVGNIFVERGSEIAILHSSAALGTAVYRKGADAWQQVRDFSWSCRDTGASEAAQAERAAFLRTEHWVAANAQMGIPSELEYQIEASEGTMLLAVVFLRASDPNEKIPWPTDLEDDCIKPTPGGLPEQMDFSPGQWGTLTFVIE
jgi:formylglycine-generating enzyme required for sulfatase activity